MGCIDCKDQRHTCGQTLSSSCIWFTGEFPAFISEDDITCKPNINDAFKLYGNKLNFLSEQANVKSLDKKCFGYDANSITPLALQQQFINEICVLKTKVSTLEAEIANFDVGSKDLVIDLQCLTADASACANVDNTYSLQAILNVIINKLCNT